MITMSPIQPDEQEEFLRMAESYFTELNPAFVPALDWKEQYFQKIVSNSRNFLRWIVCDERKAGFILFGIEDHRFLPRQNGAIYELYVLPEFRRRGIANECARRAIEELWQHSPSKIQLEVVEGAVAAAFWKSLGFRKVSERFVFDRGKLNRSKDHQNALDRSNP
jgi:ribosomal protein S18 acetylase RimI-like enzyme